MFLEMQVEQNVCAWTRHKYHIMVQVATHTEDTWKEVWSFYSWIILGKTCDCIASCGSCQHIKMCHVSSMLHRDGEDWLKIAEESEDYQTAMCQQLFRKELSQVLL